MEVGKKKKQGCLLPIFAQGESNFSLSNPPSSYHYTHVETSSTTYIEQDKVKHMVVANREKILADVKRIILTYVQDTDATVYLFGSWARGQERTTSDIDIAISYKAPLPSGTLVKIRLAFEESNIPYRVEVVDLTYSDEPFRKKIEREGIRWKG
jgi:predicted nucleotidyltransferase